MLSLGPTPEGVGFRSLRVNALDCTSTYRWKGEIHEDRERLLLAKTTDDRYDALAERVRELHPYDVPCIERIEDDPVEPFATWRADSVTPE